jgi:hypothetical protein
LGPSANFVVPVTVVQDDAPAEQGEYGAARLVCAPAFTESGPELDMTAATAGLPGTRRYEPIGRPAIRHATRARTDVL